MIDVTNPIARLDGAEIVKWLDEQGGAGLATLASCTISMLNVHAGASLTVPSPRGSSTNAVLRSTPVASPYRKTTRMLIVHCGFSEIEFR
ncbi:MAG: hypothetical protein ACLQNV_22420 [Steroidobacteraceae bacterium]